MIICINSSFSKVEKLFSITAEKRSVYFTLPSDELSLVLNPGSISMQSYLKPPPLRILNNFFVFSNNNEWCTWSWFWFCFSNNNISIKVSIANERVSLIQY